GLRLDLVGPVLDDQRPRLCVADPEAAVPQCGGHARYPQAPIEQLLPLVAGSEMPFPPQGAVSGNLDGGTRGLVQYERDAARGRLRARAGALAIPLPSGFVRARPGQDLAPSAPLGERRHPRDRRPMPGAMKPPRSFRFAARSAALALVTVALIGCGPTYSSL